jgi:hypothetical protein
VDTVPGNSEASEELLGGGVVDDESRKGRAMSIPYLYTIEVLSQNRTNATERSKFTVLYQY